MKVCTKCGVCKPFDAFYVKQRDGISARCKECSNAASRAWNKANRDRVNAATKRWRARNPATVKAQKVAWRRANPDKVRKHKLDEYLRNRGKIIARVETWRIENPDLRRAQHLRRRGLMAGAAGADYTTAAHIRARFDLYGGRCYYCSAPATSIDHRIALARGGSHWPANLVPACRSCNSRKHAKGEREFRLAA